MKEKTELEKFKKEITLFDGDILKKYNYKIIIEETCEAILKDIDKLNERIGTNYDNPYVKEIKNLIKRGLK